MTVVNYFRFTGAHYYRDAQEHPYIYEKNRLERFGDRLISPLGIPLDLTLREIKNPVTIVALTVLAAFVVTFIFYPTAVFTALPFLKLIQPWMIRGALYTLFQSFVLGWGCRAYGRFDNDALQQKWNRGEITPVFIGEKAIRV